MDRSALMLIVLALMVLLLGLMAWGWHGRRRRQAHLPAPAEVPAALGEPIANLRGKYVATTASADRLDRIAVHGLGFRGTAELTVAQNGVLMRLPDARLWIPRSALVDVHRGTWTIDRAVETDGLEVIEWMLGDHQLASAFRMPDAGSLESAVAQLIEKENA